MIRLFLTTVLMLVFAAGCGYFWWQSSQLRSDNARLRVEVVQLRKQQSRHSGRRHEPASTSASASTETEENAAAEGWLALANEHADKAKAAFDAHNYGTAQQEFTQAVDDARRAGQEPVQATQSTLAQVRRKIAQLESSVGGIVHSGASGSGQ